MKLVREHIDEKFKEQSDPIHDMGIGGSEINLAAYYDKTVLTALNNWYDYLINLIGKKITITTEHSKKITFIIKSVQIKKHSDNPLENAKSIAFTDTNGKQYDINIETPIFVHTSVNEIFKDESDPVRDMNIGGILLTDVYDETVVPAIEKWYKYLRSFCGKNITITDTASQQYTFVLKDIRVKLEFPRDLKSFGKDLFFVSSDNKVYEIDLTKRIFIN